MTQWSDEPPVGGPSGPPPGQYPSPAGQYSPSAGQYGPPAGRYAPPAGQYGPQPGAYRPPGSPYGTKPPRETGALVVCIVLLVLALIGAFVASAAVYGNLTNDSSASPAPIQGSYAPDGSLGGSSNVGGSSSVGGSGSGGGTTSPTPDPDAQAKRIIRNFPLYRGARRVASSKPYLPPGAFTSKYGTKYVVQRSANTVYNWYLRHLARDHLQYSGGAASTITDRETGKVLDAYGTLISPVTQSLNGNFNIEQGRRRGTCVLTATLYG